MDRGAWRSIVHRATESDMTELLTHTHRLASGPSHLILEGSVQVAQELECHSKPSEMPSYNNIQKSQIFVEYCRPHGCHILFPNCRKDQKDFFSFTRQLKSNNKYSVSPCN